MGGPKTRPYLNLIIEGDNVVNVILCSGIDKKVLSS